MTDATILAIVTIICTAITTSIGLLVRYNVIGMAKTIGEQTVELAKLHQTIILQSATIYKQEAQKSDAAERMGRKPHTMPIDQPYAASPPYRPPDADK